MNFAKFLRTPFLQNTFARLLFHHVGKLIKDGLLDLNVSIQTYLKDFPQKTFAGKNLDITVKDLCNHTSGMRGYLRFKKRFQEK